MPDNPEDPIERALRDEPYLANDGFSAGVLARLPARRDRRWHRRLIKGGTLAVAAGTLAAVAATSPELARFLAALRHDTVLLSVIPALAGTALAAAVAWVALDRA